MMYNTLYEGNCAEVMHNHLPDECIDLTVTSPPYDNLRKYQGFVFPFEDIAQQLYLVTKPGGVVVWIVADQTINGSETGTSFQQALYFKEIGFNLHDTMIYTAARAPLTHRRYEQAFEYMFVFSKGKPKTFHPLTEPSLHAGTTGVYRGADPGKKQNGRDKPHKVVTRKDFKIRSNVWNYAVGGINPYRHPAPFPAKLAEDHILSWSNEGDVVFDPMCGSGTTLAMAVKHKRKYIGIDISAEYLQIAQRRIDDVQS